MLCLVRSMEVEWLVRMIEHGPRATRLESTMSHSALAPMAAADATILAGRMACGASGEGEGWLASFSEAIIGDRIGWNADVT